MLGGTGVSLVIGLLGTWRALGRKVAPLKDAAFYEYEPGDDDYNAEDDYDRNIGPECVK